MHWSEITAPIQALLETPFYGELQGRDGLSCRVWQNPSRQAFSAAIRHGGPAVAGLRGLLTSHDIFVWQSMNLLHTDFERESGISGLRVALRSGQLHVNDETVDQPEQFPWIFPQSVREMDIEDRRTIVAQWLLTSVRLKRIYPAGFNIVWYS
jgi:hypothetical protein